MKKRTKILLIVVIVVLLLFLGMSYFIGTQVFMGSTQLVTCEGTSKVKDSFWERYNMDYDVFCNTYTIEQVEITSTFDGHMIPADYIYKKDENNPEQWVIDEEAAEVVRRIFAILISRKNYTHVA